MLWAKEKSEGGLEVLGQLLNKNCMQEVEIVCRRRGGDDMEDSHHTWLSTVPVAPDVIAMTFVSIASLLRGIRGHDFLSHAVDFYLQCKSLCPILLLHLQNPIDYCASLKQKNYSKP